MATLSGNQVTTLLSLGADAMDNMFDITIEPPVGISTFSNIEANRGGLLKFEDPGFKSNLTIRAEGFEPPVFKASKYKIGYKGVEIERPKTKIEGDRTFKVTFRVDANYQAYRFLMAWRSIVMQASSGYVTNALWGDIGDTTAPDINKLFGTVYVAALARPIYMTASDPFLAHGVTSGKFESHSDLSTDAVTTTPAANELTRWEFKHVWCSEVEEPKYKTDGGDIIKVSATFNFGEFVDPVMALYGNPSIV